jgi:hypothetical protein
VESEKRKAEERPPVGSVGDLVRETSDPIFVATNKRRGNWAQSLEAGIAERTE